MATTVSLTVQFVDGTTTTFEYPQQSGKDQAAIVANVKKAIESDRLLVEADGALVVIPMSTVKWVRVSPAPSHLPAGILRGARSV